MENLVFNKSKGEVFKCKLEVDGANPEDITARLCMSFPGHPGIFFDGKLDENGDCTFTIPKLGFVSAQKGKMHIEAIAEDTYFKVFEADFSLKSSVSVKVNEANINHEEPKIRVKKVSKEPAPTETPLRKPEPPVTEANKDGWTPLNVEGIFNQQQNKEPKEPKESKEKSKLRKFADFCADKKR